MKIGNLPEQSLKNGIIDAISSDHSPQNRDSKLLPFAQAKPGSLGLEPPILNHSFSC